MIEIHESHLECAQGKAVFSADISINGQTRTLWASVDEDKRQYLLTGRADFFFLMMLPWAMLHQEDIHCHEGLSDRLLYRIRHYFLPIYSQANERYHMIQIQAEPLCSAPRDGHRGVATGFSGGVDSLYSILAHLTDPCMRITHLTVFNSGVYEGRNYRENFLRAVQAAREFAREMGLEVLAVDSNISELYRWNYLEMTEVRLLGFAALLQNGISDYLFSSSRPLNGNTLSGKLSHHDFLSVHCLETGHLSIHLSGMELTRVEKLRALSQWAPAQKWLSSCIYHQVAGAGNCSHCKKCIRDMVALYAMDRLDCFREVFDTEDFLKHLSQRIAFVLASRNEDYLSREVAEFLLSSPREVPPQAWILERQFRKAIENLKNTGSKPKDTSDHL